jgi:cytidylate kinase
MVDLATTRNCVIVGRCSDYVLRKFDIPEENMLNVFIYAPIEKRLTNCKEELNIEDPGEAYRYLTKVDKAREEFYKHYTKHSFDSNRYRNLLIDSSMADFGKVADVITDTARIKFGIK